MENNQETVKEFIQDMNLLAEELYSVRTDLNLREERFKKETDDLYNTEAILKAKLLGDLKVVGIKSVKVSSGDSWFISEKTGVDVVDEGAFNIWAVKNKLVRPDKDKIKDYLKTLVKLGKELPKCVDFTKTDTISIRKQKNGNN